MHWVLHFGTTSTASLEVPAESLIAICDAPRGTPVEDVAAAVDRVLAQPLGESPPLEKSVVPGDRVVLALGPAVPQAATIVGRTVRALLAAGIAAEDIVLLQTRQDQTAGRPDPLSALPREAQGKVRLEVHDPARRETLSYLAADAGARPIYVNRLLHEADLVVPIGCLRLEGALGYYGVHSSLFPTFSDVAQLDRYRDAKSGEANQQHKLHKQSNEVGWLLGMQFTVQVVPGADEEVLHVLAGTPDVVAKDGNRLFAEAWSYEVSRRADLVIATIAGQAADQSWDNVARALAAADRALRSNGSVVLCTELNEPLGPAMQHLVGAEDLDELAADVDRGHFPDAAPAIQLIHALRRGKVYLVSRLDDELVEDLGLLPLAADQLSRVASRYDSCTVLGNAQLAIASPPGEVTTDVVSAKRKSRR
jgi:nickel-dependent lactate racemase